MKLLLITPQKNEVEYIKRFLESLIGQSRRPDLVVVVDDGSIDGSTDIIKKYSQDFGWIKMVSKPSSENRSTGGKIVEAFSFGIEEIDLGEFDLIAKLDADLILPPKYFEEVEKAFLGNDKLGICGGICVIDRDGRQIPENLNKEDHVRGALKTYRKACYHEIGGPRATLGWDTLDEHLARFHGWEVEVKSDLWVVHLRPTNTTSKWYNLNFRHGQMFHEQRYGVIWGFLSSMKRGIKHKPFIFSGIVAFYGFIDSVFRRRPFIISKEEGKYLRNYRTRLILKA